MKVVELSPLYIRAISPYQPGKPISELAREMNIPEASIVKLASNENPLGMSPHAKQAVALALNDSARYPDGNGFELKKALSSRYDIGMEHIVLGNGSNDVLDLAARVFLQPGVSAVYSQHAFAVYPLVTQIMGATGIEVPAKQYGHDLVAMRDAITPQTRIVFIANPNNPTGTFVASDVLLSFLEAVPRNVIVILDEAYNEYLPPHFNDDSIAWLKRFPNLLITRTFSKAYGLAGLRVGFALANPDVADLMNRMRQPFNVNNIALAAAAAALKDEDFVGKSVLLNKRGMAQIISGCERLGLAYIPSYGNFVSIRVGNAAQINLALLKQGVIVRPIAGYGLPEYLRVSIGLESENARFLSALEQALKQVLM